MFWLQVLPSDWFFQQSDVKESFKAWHFFHSVQMPTFVKFELIRLVELIFKAFAIF